MFPLPLPGLNSRARGGAVSPPASAPITAVSADGWQATIAGTPPTNYEPPVDLVDFTVQRPGFDATGAATTLNDQAWINCRLRLAYPNENTLTADTCILSDFIYSTDVISGVTNNSTKAYPDPICTWLQHDHFPIFDSTFTVDLAVCHKFARNGRPVAAVKIIASDGTTTRETTVSSLTFRSWAATGLGADVFSATFTSADFASATAITIDAIIYPWAGPSYQLSTQGLAAPNMKNCTITGWRVAQVFAYVDASTGNDTTGVASETAASAAAAPCLTVAGACTKIAAYNNSTYGRNEIGGGTIRYPVGTWTVVGGESGAFTITTACLIYESINPADKATTILQDNGVLKTGTNITNRLIVRNLTLRKTAGDFNIFRNGNGIANVFVTDNVAFDLNGTSSYEGWLLRVGRFWSINCSNLSGNLGQYAISGTVARNVVLFGSNATGSQPIWMIGCTGPSFTLQGSAAVTLGLSRGAIYNCLLGPTSGTGYAVTLTGTWLANPGEGFAIVGTVIEKTLSGGALFTFADSSTATVYDLLVQNLTLPGNSDFQRWNRPYSDVPTATGPKQATVFSCIWPRSACKVDTFLTSGGGTDAAWAVSHKVGHSYLTHVEGFTAGNAEYLDPDSWRFAAVSLGEQIGDGAGGALDPLWVDDQTPNSGGGDYRPQSGSPLQRIPAGRAVTARDFNGTAIPDDGTAFVGALQP